MAYALLASAALLATGAVAQIGSANVVNSCPYDVYVTNVPASGGGQSQIGPNTLSTGQSYSQVYTELTNGDGWSIKLSKDAALSQIMQYEYTFHNDGIIWFDLSDVNGDPWGGDWAITATGDCTPKQTAYQFSTDDAYGMQACPDASAVTVNLCGSGSGSSGGSPPMSSPQSPSPPETPTPSVPSSPVAPVGGAPSWGGLNLAATASTLATSVVTGAPTVTNVHTVVVTQTVTMSPVPAPAAKRDDKSKKHEHLHRHKDHHKHH